METIRIKDEIISFNFSEQIHESSKDICIIATSMVKLNQFHDNSDATAETGFEQQLFLNWIECKKENSKPKQKSLNIYVMEFFLGKAGTLHFSTSVKKPNP